MNDDIVDCLRSLHKRFIFQGGSPFANRLADEIEILRRALGEDTVEILVSLMQNRDALAAENERLRAELAKYQD